MKVNGNDPLQINIRSWYPAFLVRWITRYKIWKDRR